MAETGEEGYTASRLTDASEMHQCGQSTGREPASDGWARHGGQTGQTEASDKQDETIRPIPFHMTIGTSGRRRSPGPASQRGTRREKRLKERVGNHTSGTTSLAVTVHFPGIQPAWAIHAA